MKYLISLLTTLLCANIASAQTISNNGFFGSGSGGDPASFVTLFGGLLIEPNPAGPHFFYVNPTTKVKTDYLTCAGMFTALSGSVVSSVKWTYDSTGTLVSNAANTPICNAYNGFGNFLGIPYETTGIQFLLQSENLSSASWTKTGVTVSANQRTSPKGVVLTAPLVIEDGSTGEHKVSQAITKTTSLLTYTLTCYFAPGSGNRVPYVKVLDGAGNGNSAVFLGDPTTGVPAATTIGTGFTSVRTWNDWGGLDATALTSPYGYVRVGITFTSTANTTLTSNCGLAQSDGTVSYTGDGVSSDVIWGANLVGGPSTLNWQVQPRSYIPTTTVSVTPVRDQIKLTVPAGLQTYSALSFVASFRTPRIGTTTTNTMWALVNSSAQTNWIRINQSSALNSGTLAAQVNNGTSNANYLISSPQNIYDQSAGMAGVIVSGHNFVENSGQGIRTSTGTNMPSVATDQLNIGAALFGGSDNAALTQFGALTMTAILPVALSTSQLQSLLFDTPPFNPDVLSGANFFTQATLASKPAGWDVFRLASLSATETGTNDLSTYPYTIAYNQSPLSNKNSTMTTAQYAVLPWGDRCDLCSVPNKANSAGGSGFNLSDGVQARVSMSTFTISRAIFTAQQLWLLNYPATAAGACSAGAATSGSAVASGSGTNITVSGSSDSTFIWPGYVLTGTGIPANTQIVSQTSGTGTYPIGRDGVYVTNNATTIAGSALTITSNQKWCGYNDVLDATKTTFTGTSAGSTSMTISGASGAAIEAGVFIHDSSCTTTVTPTYLVSQSSGTPGGNGVYITNQATTCAGISLVTGVDKTQNFTYQQGSTNPLTYFKYYNTLASGTPYWVAIDRVAFHDANLVGGTARIYGILCDCEFSDRYLASKTTADIIEWANAAHNAAVPLKYAFTPDGLFGAGTAGGFCGSGLSPSITPPANCDMGTHGSLTPMINVADHMIVPISYPPGRAFTSATDQLNKNITALGIGFNPLHLILQIGMGPYPPTTRYIDAVNWRNYILALGYSIGGVSIVNAFQTPGGQSSRCYNQKISYIVTGSPAVSPVDALCGI